MRQFSFHMVWLSSLLVALAQISSLAQEFQGGFKPRVVYEREVEHAPKEIHKDYRNSYFTKSNRGILTRLGTELLVNDPANQQIIVVDTKSLEESCVQTAFPATEVQTDTQTDMLFLNTFKNDDGAEATQTCYENLNAFRNEQPMWSFHKHGLFHKQQIRWLGEHQRFILYSLHGGHLVFLLDPNGVKLAEHDFKDPIKIVGVDEVKEGFNIFYLIKSRVARKFAMAQLDGDFKVRKTQTWPLVDRPQNLGVSSLGISRSFRLRGLKSGEVTKYFLEDSPQPGYLDANGRLPVANFKSKWFAYANKLSAADSPLQPEILVGINPLARNWEEFILFDQQSSYYHVPDQCLTDAFFDEERKMIVTVADSKKSGYWKVRLISFD